MVGVRARVDVRIEVLALQVLVGCWGLHAGQDGGLGFAEIEMVAFAATVPDVLLTEDVDVTGGNINTRTEDLPRFSPPQPRMFARSCSWRFFRRHDARYYCRRRPRLHHCRSCLFHASGSHPTSSPSSPDPERCRLRGFYYKPKTAILGIIVRAMVVYLPLRTSTASHRFSISSPPRPSRARAAF